MNINVTLQIVSSSTINQVLQGIVYGLSLSMLYALIAIGLTIIFGLMDVLNFAHGAFVTAGAYIGLTIINTIGSFWLALVVVMLVLGLTGIIVERGLINQLYGSNPIFQLVLTFGVALLIEGLIIIQFGQNSRQVSAPSVLTGTPLSIGSIVIPRYRLFIIVFSLLLLAFVWVTLQRTKIGLIIKAGIQDRERTQLLGIQLGRINMLVFAVGAMFAGLAGIMMGPLFSVSPRLGQNFLIITFVIVVIGGLGDIRGTIAGAILIGILSQLMQTFYPEFSNAAIFLAMICVLLIKPRGIFGGQAA